LNKEDIELHLVKSQELRRLKTMRKKWFVLYENSDPNQKRKDQEEEEEGEQGSKHNVSGVQKLKLYWLFMIQM